MRKREIQQNRGFSATIRHAEGVSGKRKFLRYTWIFILCLSLTGFLALLLFLERTTWIDAEGVVHEPLFALFPITDFFFYVALILALLDRGILTLWDKISTANADPSATIRHEEVVSGKRKFLRYTWMLTLYLSLVSFVCLFLLLLLLVICDVAYILALWDKSIFTLWDKIFTAQEK